MRNNIVNKYLFICLTAGLFLLAGCSKPNYRKAPPPGSTGTINAYLNNNFDLSLFAYAVKQSGFADSLNAATGAFTVLSPVNSALNKAGIYNNSDWDKWSADSLKRFVKTYILRGKLFYSDIPIISDNVYFNLNNQILYFSKTKSDRFNGMYLIVNGVIVQSSGSLAAYTYNYGTTTLNGVVYPLLSTIKIFDGTVQQFLAARSDMKVLSAGFTKFGLMDRLGKDGNYTVVAPPDSAFARYGITTDSIGRMDTSQFDPALFGIYQLQSRHIYLLDLVQLNPNNLSMISYTTNSDSILLSMNVNGNGLRLMSAVASLTNGNLLGPAGVNGPNNPYSGASFLGEQRDLYGFISETNPPLGTWINYTCSNGIVHLLSQVLLLPGDVSKK